MLASQAVKGMHSWTIVKDVMLYQELERHFIQKYILSKIRCPFLQSEQETIWFVLKLYAFSAIF